MGAKRALIVDDSKSARAFLSRILEKYDIEVDSAESAEQAIEYLGHNRPDVIFMDHMMPGMDGFQAVQAIKNNPRTAMIPIMMYTSQEGELYLGQARALGAVGVLPKQIKPADVSKVLYQLHLLPDRRSPEQTSFRPVNDLNMSMQDIDAGSTASMPRPLTETALREQFAELRRAFVASLDSQAERIASDLRVIVQDAIPPPPPPPEPQRSRPWGWVTAAFMLAIAAASAAAWWSEFTQRRALAEELRVLREAQQATPAPAAALVPAAPTGVTAVPALVPVIEPVPYGAEPLGGSRLEIIRQYLDRLVAQGFEGTVEIKAYPGRFCLVGNATEGLSLPPDELLHSRCDVVGLAPDEMLPARPREPLAFADLVREFSAKTGGAASVEVAYGDTSNTIVPYPEVSETLTAGEWNRAASANNRIEIRVR